MRSTADAYLGLDAASPEEWERWHRAMLEERDRAGIGHEPSWSDTAFRQVFVFMYDTSFFAEGRYRTTELIESWQTKFGRVDEALLWHAYPRLGFDTRTQFDFYRQMPGGLERLRADVCDVLHARGIRVAVDFNPWDEGTYAELAEIVSALDADAVMLDTMTDVPDALMREVERRKPGVVFEPELRLKNEDLARARRSWAQWLDIGDDAPSIYRNRWLARRHMQLAIARWDTSRKRDVVYSFFHGTGLVLWENVFGTWNPYSREDRRLVAETAAVLESYGDLFAYGEWLPLIPTGVSGLDANRFVDEKSGRAIVTFRNRTARALAYPVDAPCFAFWGDEHELSAGDRVVVEPHGTQAIVVDEPENARRALAHFEELSGRAGAALQGDERTRPKRTPAPIPTRASRTPMIAIPGGTFDMHVTHERRECGCYGDFTWGSPYQERITHRERVEIAPLAIRATAVTNAEFLEFVHRSGYRPRDPERFLAHVARDGALPKSLPASQALLPVTYVSLADARAFAAFHGERLPTEAEWQWVAEGAGAGRRFPWGDDERTFSPNLHVPDSSSATPHGVMGLAGNAWELTESEHDDGHTRFVMLRGGVYLPPGGSEWLVARGVRRNDSHAKYILLSDGLDRSESVSFRTVSGAAAGSPGPDTSRGRR